MRFVFTFLCYAASAIFATSNASPFVANGANYDIVYHRISISVDPTGGSRAITNGSVTTYFLTTVTNVNSLQFDLDGAMAVSSATYHGSAITKNHNTTTDVLTLTLPSTIASIGTLDSVTVFYSGSPATPTTSIPSGYNVKVHNTSLYAIYTLDEAFTAHYWWPCKETLYDKIDSVDLIVTAPSSYKVAGNGLVTEVISGANRITTWKTRYASATYGINFAVANYQNYQFNITTGGKTYPVMNYFYAEDNTSTFQGYADQLKNIIPAFVNVLNVNYPFANEKYGLAQCTGNWGALEVQSMTFMSRTSYNDNGYTLAHEAAHQWFGDMVTPDSWHQIWLSEGFAQYFQSVIYPENLRPGDLTSQRSALKSAVTSNANTTVYVPDTVNADRIFFDPSAGNSQPYNKGAMLISMLRTWIGDTGFFNALHDYLLAPKIKYGFGSVDSLEKYMQNYTTLSLGNFFDDWVYKQGFAKYNIGWSNVGNRVIIQLTQSPSTAGAGYFDMPVPIRITNGNGLDTTVTIIDRRGVLYNSSTGLTNGTNKIAFNLSASPSAVSLDPKNLVLATAGTIGYNVTLSSSEISLQAKKTGNNISFNWKAEADQPLTSLLLEKSIDGNNFSTFKNLKPVTSSTVHEGTCMDFLAYNLQFYRLKMSKQNGEELYSKVETVAANNTPKVEAMPNPVTNELTLTVPAGFITNEAVVIIRNASGQCVLTCEKKPNSGQVKVLVSQLSAGMYWARLVNSKGEMVEVNFLKQ